MHSLSISFDWSATFINWFTLIVAFNIIINIISINIIIIINNINIIVIIIIIIIIVVVVVVVVIVYLFKATTSTPSFLYGSPPESSHGFEIRINNLRFIDVPNVL